jgi:hypothetical protein
MSAFQFSGPIPYQYPDSRDTTGIHLGEVSPGDVRDLDEAPDRWWVPAGEGEGDGPGELAGAPAGSPAPDGPQPAPPAVVIP